MTRAHDARAAASPGWSLVDPRTGYAIDPVTLVGDERIETADRE
jgi:hypothetical protein